MDNEVKIAGVQTNPTILDVKKNLDTCLESAKKSRQYPSLARQKHRVTIPGELELDRIRNRRPEFYGELVKPLQDISRIRLPGTSVSTAASHLVLIVY